MRSIVHIVLEHAQVLGDKPAVWCISQRKGEATRTWKELARDIARAAAGWQRLGVKRGDVVVLIGTHHIDFYAAWLGAVWLGAVPTVLAEPGVRIHKDVYAARTAALMERIGAHVLAKDPRVTLVAGVTAATVVDFDTLAQVEDPAPALVDVDGSDLLLLQHSSGTTGLQKGVMLTHGAVLAHAASYAQVTGLDRSGVVATWLPLYHDMGLIACFVGQLLAGASVAWLSPFEWVAAPQQLLDIVERFGATHAWLPNFAFMFLAKRARKNASVKTLRHVVNCSEVVTAEAMDAFVERFAHDGFDAPAMTTCYAMAENVFAMTSSSATDPPRRMRVDRGRWREMHVAAPTESPEALVHVSSGRPVPGVEVEIVDDGGARCPPLQAGGVHVRSPFLFAGYYRRADLPSGIDARGFFDTGDVGYVDADGHLFVTGRQKDVIIAAGKNIYPQDIEAAADRVEGVHPGRAVAFGVALPAQGTDGVVVLAESDLEESAWPDVAARLRTAVTSTLEIDLVDVRVVGRQALRKSTSGKLARSGNRTWYLEGKFGAVPDVVGGAGGDA